MGIFYILVRIVVCLKVLGKKLVQVVRTMVRVVLQKYMDCLEKRRVLMIGGYLFDILLVRVVGGSWDVVGGDWCGGC